MEDLRTKVMEIGALPAISKAASKLLVLPLDTDRGEEELLRIIESDPFITARVIGMANSPFFSTGRKVSTVDEAAMVLGLSIVKSVAVAIALIGSIKIRESRVFSLNDLWLHSFSMAIGMRALSNMLPREKRPAEGMLFLSGLLHDMGYLAIAYLYPKQFEAFIRHVESQPDVPVTVIEMEEFRIGHAEIGGILGRAWHLPEEVVSVIEGHHAAQADKGNIPLILARIIESITGETAMHRPPASMVAPEELEALGLGTENTEEIRELLEMQWAMSFTV